MAIETALVVDDSRSARFILQRLLERKHVHVDSVESAEEALSYLNEVRPDVVFMDDMLPGMDGQEAIERLGADPRTADIPIVMYTARDYSADASVSQRKGVIGVLSKPFASQDVEALLAKLGGTVAPPPMTPRLVRLPPRPALPSIAADTMLMPRASEDIAHIVATRVAAEMHALRGYLSDQVKVESRAAAEQVIGEFLESEIRAQFDQHENTWKRSLNSVRNEHERFQKQVLEQRIPRLLAVLEQRLKTRMESLQKAINERIDNNELGSLQRAQVMQIARSAAGEAAQRPAREAARHVAAELLRNDINALNVRLDRLRRRFGNLVAASILAVVAAAVLGYLAGRMG